MLVQLSEKEWKLICEPVWICSLPLQASELTGRFGLEFKSVLEDGLGIVQCAFASIAGKPILLKAYIDGLPEAQFVSVWILGQETAWEEIILNLCAVFGLKRDGLPFVQTELKPGSWVLSRLDDNGNQVEMFRFPDKFRAEQCQQEYEKRGHKQAYFVRMAS